MVVGGLSGVGCPEAWGPTEGSSTPRAADEAPGVVGVGSTETHPAPGPRYTSGHAWASAPVTVYAPVPSLAPGRKPTATRVGRPRLRASTAKAPANCWHEPALVTV